MNKPDIKKISVAAMLTAVAFLCTFIFRFKVSFLTFDFKDAVISIVSLLYGPVWGISAAGIVAFFEMISMSETAIYGMVMNFLSSGTFALTTGLVYKYNRTFKGAIISVALSAFTVTAVMMLANIFITPLYLGVSSADVIALIPTLLLPFNLAKSVMNAAIILIIYKPVTKALKRVGLIPKKTDGEAKPTVKSIVLLAVSLTVIIATVLFLIFYMGGSFQLLVDKIR